MLRWGLQRGRSVVPKSTEPAHIAENLDVFDFELTDEQVQKISALDQGEDGRTGPNPDEFDYIPD